MDEMIKERALRLFPDKAVYNLKETAQILGISPQTLYNNKERYAFGALITLSDIERVIKRAAPRRQSGKRRTQRQGYASKS